ncbi:MAG: hypothetical protein ACREJN_02120 [Nitrospiraceae bacterium]
MIIKPGGLRCPVDAMDEKPDDILDLSIGSPTLNRQDSGGRRELPTRLQQRLTHTGRFVSPPVRKGERVSFILNLDTGSLE